MFEHKGLDIEQNDDLINKLVKMKGGMNEVYHKCNVKEDESFSVNTAIYLSCEENSLQILFCLVHKTLFAPSVIALAFDSIRNIIGMLCKSAFNNTGEIGVTTFKGRVSCTIY